MKALSGEAKIFSILIAVELTRVQAFFKVYQMMSCAFKVVSIQVVFNASRLEIGGVSRQQDNSRYFVF